MSSTARRGRRVRVAHISAIVGAVVLAGAMVAGTTFVPASEAVDDSALNVDVFVAELLPEVGAYVTSEAVPLSDIATAAASDPTNLDGFGVAAGSGKRVIPVDVSGVVDSVDNGLVTLGGTGLPADQTVVVAVGQAVSGAALRDATGEYSFSDFANQTEYQQVANRLKVSILDQLADSTPAVGSAVAVRGLITTGAGPAGTYVITPLTIEVPA